MAPSRVEDIFPKTQRLTPSIGPKFTSDAITVYGVLKATHLEYVTLFWNQLLDWKAELMICKKGKLSAKNWVCKKSNRASTDSTTGSNLVVSNSFFIGINYNAQNRLLYSALWLYMFSSAPMFWRDKILLIWCEFQETACLPNPLPSSAV